MGESIKFAVEYTTPFLREKTFQAPCLVMLASHKEMRTDSDNTGYWFLKGFKRRPHIR
jgi:hypothetical protein